MKKTKGKVIDRILALLLTFVLVAGMIPTTAFATTVDPVNYTITVVEEDGQTPIENATIKYSIEYDGNSISDQSVTTDKNGEATIDLSTVGMTEDSTGTLTYTISCDDYVSVDETTIEVTGGNSTTVELLKVTKTVKVEVTGKATVKMTVDGTTYNESEIVVVKGTEVEVEIIPADGAYIKTVTEGAVPEKYQSYNEKIVANADITIEATVMEEVKVTAKAGTNGSITLNGSSDEEILADKGSEVEAVITPNTGYQIASVTVNNESQNIQNPGGYTQSIKVSEATTIEATFVKVYTVAVVKNGDGTVKVDSTEYGGNVVVEEGEIVKINAVPDPNWRVSAVTINDERIQVSGANDSSYETSLKADKNYNVQITFALNTYKVSASTTGNGDVNVGTETVEYGKSSVITVTPSDGNAVESITVNGTEWTDFDYNDDDKIEFTIENVTEAQEVKVTFVQTGTTTLDNVEFDNDYIRSAGQTYVYAKDKAVTFTTDMNGIRLYKDDDKKPFVTASKGMFGSAKDTYSVKVDATTNITKIELYYKTGFQYKWVAVDTKYVSKDNPIKIVIDTTVPEATLTPDANAITSGGFYNDTFKVDVSINDSVGDTGNEYSGIEEAVYWITCDDEITQEETSLGSSITANITSTIEVKVDEDTNNSDDVVVHVRIKDKAGNEREYATDSIKVNCTAPILESVAIDGTLHKIAADGYYNVARTAKVVIVDRASSFDEQAATEGIIINAKDAEKELNLNKTSMISWNHNGDVHTATILFDENASYEWSIDYTNKANLAMDKGAVVETGDSMYEFTVDTEAPTGKIKLLEKTWSKLLEKLSFGLWTNKEVTATVVDSKDTVSPLYDITYYKTKDTLHSEKELEELYTAGEFVNEPITIGTTGEDEQFVVYARIADYAGNILYLGTDGAVFDNTDGKIEIIPEDANENGFYNEDVDVTIKVTEMVGDVAAYSGIKTIEYWVENNGEVTQKQTLYNFDFVKEGFVPEYEDLKESWEGVITVDAKKNNADNISVKVKVVDNAGNEYEAEKNLAINADEVKANISIDGTPNKIVGNRGYYSVENRKATITITDRASAFDEEAATNGINVKDAKGNKITGGYEISTWSHNGNEHTAEVTFSEDANYTWSFNYTNKAGNSLDVKRNLTTKGETPFEFTVDDTDPYGTIAVKENIWTKLLEKLTFGLFSIETVDITSTSDDDTSPVTVEYYKTDNTSPYIATTLDDLYVDGQFATYEDFSVDANDRFVVYLRITDYAGNYTYINSDGYVVDNAEATIELSPSDANENGYYKDDVEVGIKVNDAEPYSGIKTIEYWVEKDGVVTQEQALYKFDFVKDETNETNNQGGTLTITDWASGEEVVTTKEGIVPEYEDLINTWEGTVVVDDALNNSCNVVVFVKVVDNAGNEDTSSVELDVDDTEPVIDISYDNNADNNGNTYFDAQRTATVVITERTHHFDSEKATAGIIITAKDAKGNDVAEAYTLSSWTTVPGNTPDEDTHTATIFFEKDANYTLDISYIDDAGNENEVVNTGDSVAPFDFTVDTTAPTGTVKATSAEGREVEWEKLRDKLTFGFWSKKKITISGTSDDETSSPIASVEYYKVSAINGSDKTTPMTVAELDAVTEWKAFTQFDVKANEQFVVYIKITDLAGNYTYLSTNGLIVDDQAPLEETIAPEITIDPEQPINGIYNNDVKVAIKVTDPLVGGTYSGLKTITYEVKNMGEVTQSGELYSFDMADPEQADLLQTWTGEITVDSELNNSNDVEIVVYAEDNSLNGSEDSEEIKIDITAPTIEISYNNNNADSSKYFKANRTATIVVTERNFNADDVITTIKNTDGYIPKVSSWKKTAADGNGDDTTWTATVKYTKDGDYKFSIKYSDLAGNKATDISFADGTVASKSFTIDKTDPKIHVSYDNNSALNGNYYKATRTATITVTEHNFNPNRVNPLITATDNGASVGIPSISSWRNNGDVHTATITYSSDAYYTFDITMKDKAGNESANYTEETFYVDKTIPVLTISGVANNSANIGDVIPVVSFSDTNFDPNQSTITLTGANRGSVKLDGSYSNGNNGRTFTFKNFAKEKEVDDIYTLTAATTDKAGNTFTKSITFSVNRFGSTYELSKKLKEINGSYVKEPEDVVITETNPNSLKNIKITLFKNNETIVLEEGHDYRIDVSGGNGEWYRYKYTIFKDNFTENGVYRITVYSEDAAGNVAENTLDTKNMEVGFGVDSENPLINITNLEDETTYPVENLTVLMTATDNLVLSSVVVYLDGEEVPYKEWTAEEILELLSSDGEFNFDIAGDSKGAHNVKVIALDAAGNEQIVEVKDFYVTTDLWVRFFNNKPLFYGSIGAVLLLLGFFFFIILGKKKKEDEEEENVSQA